MALLNMPPLTIKLTGPPMKLNTQLSVYFAALQLYFQ